MDLPLKPSSPLSSFPLSQAHIHSVSHVVRESLCEADILECAAIFTVFSAIHEWLAFLQQTAKTEARRHTKNNSESLLLVTTATHQRNIRLIQQMHRCQPIKMAKLYMKDLNIIHFLLIARASSEPG